MLERRHLLFGWTAGVLLLDSSANLIGFGTRLLDVAAAYATGFFLFGVHPGTEIKCCHLITRMAM
jgi:hypothetical protein